MQISLCGGYKKAGEVYSKYDSPVLCWMPVYDGVVFDNWHIQNPTLWAGPTVYLPKRFPILSAGGENLFEKLGKYNFAGGIGLFKGTNSLASSENTLKAYDGNASNTDSASWAGYAYIAFEVENKDEITEQTYDKCTNGTVGTIIPKPYAKKFVSAVKHTALGETTDKPTNKAPSVVINTDADIGDDERVVTTNENAPYVKTVNGDEVVYTVRIYNPSTKMKINLKNYTLNDTPEIHMYDTQTYLEYMNVEGDSKIATNKIEATPSYDDDERTKNVKIKIIDDVLLDESPDINNPNYAEIKIRFKVHVPDAPAEYDYQAVTTYNNLGESSVPVEHNFGVSGKVFIDQKNYDNGGKTTTYGNKLFDNGEGIDGVKVELLDAETGNLVQISDDTGTLVQNPTYTHDGGNYSFGYLDYKKTHFDTTTATEVVDQEEGTKKYKVRFTYNGQEYENVTYEAAGGTKENQSHATELKYEIRNPETGEVTQTIDDRATFNDKFATINGSNSSTYSLKNDDNKMAGYKLNEQGTYERAYNEAFDINAWIGNDGAQEVDVKSDIAHCLNLGIVKREFDLELHSKLKGVDISINDVNTHVDANDAGDQIDYNKLSDWDLYFRDSDYSYTNTDSTKELSVWLNYEISVSNISADDFIGVLNAINLSYDSDFDLIQYSDTTNLNTLSSQQDRNTITKENATENLPTTSSTDGKQTFVTRNIAINKQVTRSGNYVLYVSLHLNRETIAKKILSTNYTYDQEKNIESSEWYPTLELIGEIQSYGSLYNGDIYSNGHGGEGINAGKIDEDSNAGSVSISNYLDIKSQKSLTAIQSYFSEDDQEFAMRLRLMSKRGDGFVRKISGCVFEDKTQPTNIDGEDKTTRLGDGKIDPDKPIEGVTVELIDMDNNNNNTAKALRDSIEETLENQDGKNTVINNVSKIGDSDYYSARTRADGIFIISGFIPANNYILKFTYGDGSTLYYNAQDYKSTIDKTDSNYSGYWYENDKEKIKNKSVAKDEDTRMTTENYDNSNGKDAEGKDVKVLDNKSATTLNHYNNVSGKEAIFKNSAITASMAVPLEYCGDNEASTLSDSTREYKIQNINLGLAERPRSELVITKAVDRVEIIAQDGSTTVVGENGEPVKTGISWIEGYNVQPIIDANLFYGSTLKVTYKITVENTGEVDYMATGYVGDDTRTFYDYGKAPDNGTIVKTRANMIMDYVDDNLVYSNDTKYYNSTNETNEDTWEVLSEDYNTLLSKGKFAEDDDNTKEYFNSKKVKIISKPGSTLGTALEPGKSIEGQLTLTKVLSSADTSDLLVYDNTLEIMEQINTAGRRSYRTLAAVGNREVFNNTVIESKGEDGIKYFTYNEDLLSDVSDAENRAIPVNMETDKEKFLILSIPGDIGNPTESTTSTDTTLYWEPDCDKAEQVQIIEPFGNSKEYNKYVWITIGILSAIVLGGGIFLIKRYVVNKK